MLLCVQVCSKDEEMILIYLEIQDPMLATTRVTHSHSSPEFWPSPVLDEKRQDDRRTYVLVGLLSYLLSYWMMTESMYDVRYLSAS